MLVKLSNEHIKEAELFSQNVNTSFYAGRNQFNPEKRKLDSKIGKLGEFAVYDLLINKYPDLTLPDTKIYSAKDKSWDYDMKCSAFNLHIKSQTIKSGNMYGVSFLFEKTDKHIFKENQEKDYVAFVSVDENTNEALIRSILPVKVLHDDNLFKKPKLDKLVSKCAIYFDDIKNYKIHLV